MSPAGGPDYCGFDDEDLAKALEGMESFVDVTPEDLREIYRRPGAARRRRAGAGARPRLSREVRGGGHAPPGEHLREIAWSCLGAVLGIGACALLSAAVFEPLDATLLIGSFGASAVLVYAAIRSLLAQPRNLLGGHVVSALAGVACWELFGHTPGRRRRSASRSQSGRCSSRGPCTRREGRLR